MSTDSIKDGINNITDDAHDLLAATADVADKKVVEARNRLSSALAAARETYRTVQNKAMEGAKATDKVIRENPYQSIAVAFGIGAVLGYLLSRRGDK